MRLQSLPRGTYDLAPVPFGSDFRDGNLAGELEQGGFDRRPVINPGRALGGVVRPY
jgi:hypothetical protein